jgi:hypothetical protein
MIADELGKFFASFTNEQAQIMTDKGTSYSGVKDGEKKDRLANFKRIAADMDLTPMQVWLVYFLKHVDSVKTFVRTGHESEGFRSRALDIANYAILGAALVSEDENA